MELLGVEIDNLTREEILARLKMFLDEPKFHQIATINPEFLVEAEKNKDFHEVLQQCDLRIADGFGIALAFFLKSERLKCRFPGADLLEEILNIAEKKKLSVYLAIRKDGLSSYEEIKFALLKKYPTLKIDGRDFDITKNSSSSLITYPASLIHFCNFGAPEQEIFLPSLKGTAGTLRLAMGVGGSFDYITGKQRRAPEWLRALGLEWLWRLIRQPKRWRRIWKAVVVFPLKIFRQKENDLL
ncbi:MAG: WecB/TagA/CpsF family glycosyltransferase [bacterium]|nr:WecB/TagA/CpsF family glycosyltransferase [bacterium]